MKARSKPIIIFAALAACIGLGIFYQLSSKPVEQQPPVPVPEISKPVATYPSRPEKTVKVYHVAVQNSQPVLKPLEKTVQPGKDPEETAIRFLIEQGDGARASKLIPEGTRLLRFTRKGDLAVVDLSSEFSDNFQGGSDAEEMVVNSILRTLGQFPDIKRVQLMVQGKPIDTLGHLDLSGPLKVNTKGFDIGGSN